jgi:regulator of replication initiation timing
MTTCTHHNDQQRTECTVCLVTALRAELAVAQNWVQHKSHHADDLIAENVELRAERDQLRDRLSAAQQREATAISSWDEERNRALREGERVVEWRARAERAEAELTIEKEKVDGITETCLKLLRVLTLEREERAK